MNSIWLAFLTGITTGGLSCLAVQGGLLASSITQTQSQQGSSPRWLTTSLFLIAKLVSYTLLGLVLGGLGSLITLSVKTQGILQILVGLFVLATAARLLNLHPIFRYLEIKPPSWAYRYLRRLSKNESYLSPLLLGFLTVLVPCGITQTMMVLAVGSGSPWQGAAILFAFTLGTSPVFFAIGMTAVELLRHKRFQYLAAGLIAIFAVLSINGGLALAGSIYTLQNFYKAATVDQTKQIFAAGRVAPQQQGKQLVTISVSSNGYSTPITELHAGVPVQLSLETNRTRGCTRVFTIPTYNISKVLPETGTEVIEFTPARPGRLQYSCGMGMYTGSFSVI